MRFGFFAGLPQGDAAELTELTVGFDGFYMIGINKTFDASITAGYSHSFAKDRIEVNGEEVSGQFDDTGFARLGGGFQDISDDEI